MVIALQRVRDWTEAKLFQCLPAGGFALGPEHEILWNALEDDDCQSSTLFHVGCPVAVRVYWWLSKVLNGIGTEEPLHLPSTPMSI